MRPLFLLRIVLVDAVLSARLVDLGAKFDLLEEADYLGFTQSGFLHVETPLGGFSTSGWFRFSKGLHIDLLDRFFLEFWRKPLCTHGLPPMQQR